MSTFVGGLIIGFIVATIFGGAIIAWLKKEKNILALRAKNLEDKLSHHEKNSTGSKL